MPVFAEAMTGKPAEAIAKAGFLILCARIVEIPRFESFVYPSPRIEPFIFPGKIIYATP
jgi:hypothetical protein